MPRNLITEMLGQPNPYLKIDATAFNGQNPCFTIDNITVYIEVSKKVIGVHDWKLIRYGTKVVEGIFYYDYPDHSKTVNVTLQAVDDYN